ncbi:MAG: transglutaminaseTgpA domain-containing protein, partial [Myxococcota bacterium]
MTLRIAHILALYATLALPVLGLMSGSPFLLGAGVVYFLLLLVGIPHLHEVQRPLPRTVVVHALTVAGLVAALSIFRRAPIDAGLGIVMLGVLNRFLLRGGQRDDLILVGAAGVLLAAATVITPGFSFALLVVAFVPAALWAMLSASILGLAERSPVESRARLVKVYGARPVPRLGGTLTAWGLLLMVAGYAAVSFLPRYRFSGMLGAGGLVAFSGAGSSMTLTSGGVTGGGDGSVALLVDGPRGDLEGLYARLYVLDTLEDGTFRDGEGTVRHYPQGRAGNREGCRDVTLRRQVGRSRPHPVAVLGRQGPSAVSLSPRRKLLRYDSGSWAQRLSRSELDLRYHACIGQNVPAALPRSPTIRDALLTRYTQLPPDLDPRVRDLAQRISEGSTGPEDTTRRVLRHFGTGYAYSLDPLPGTEEDPLVRFLFEARRGHCELYAGAVAVLLRAAGVPARVATGYYGGWYNVRSRALEMGSDDAHAWVEVLIDGRWIWVDATPEDLRARRT